MRYPKLKIFCDFDGTVTKKDVWVDALGRFIKDKKPFDVICKDFEFGRITSRECIKRELDLIEDFSFEEFDTFIEQQELDDYFLDFIDYCNQMKFEVTLLSEGLDYYVNYVIKKFNIKLKYYSNRLLLLNLNGKVKLTCDFPYSDEHCNTCGVSKRNLLMANTNDLDKEISVFIGDGVSDFCVSSYADVVFAKNKLASYCWKNNITYYEYKDFRDIKNKFVKIIENGVFKQKQNAKTLRKEVLLGG